MVVCFMVDDDSVDGSGMLSFRAILELQNLFYTYPCLIHRLSERSSPQWVQIEVDELSKSQQPSNCQKYPKHDMTADANSPITQLQERIITRFKWIFRSP